MDCCWIFSTEQALEDSGISIAPLEWPRARDSKHMPPPPSISGARIRRSERVATETAKLPSEDGSSSESTSEDKGSDAKQSNIENASFSDNSANGSNIENISDTESSGEAANVSDVDKTGNAEKTGAAAEKAEKTDAAAEKAGGAAEKAGDATEKAGGAAEKAGAATEKAGAVEKTDAGNADAEEHSNKAKQQANNSGSTGDNGNEEILQASLVPSTPLKEPIPDDGKLFFIFHVI